MFLSGVFTLFRNAVWVAAIVGVVADAASTEYALTENSTAYEANPLLAPVVEAGLIWPFTLMVCVALFFFARPLWNYHHKNNIQFLIGCFMFLAVTRFLVVANNLQVAAGY